MPIDPGERTWLIQKQTPDSSAPFDSFMASVVGPNTETVSVVEESRAKQAEARCERLEAELGETREALDWVTTRYESTLAQEPVRDADEAISRARGVLTRADTSEA